MERTQFCDYLPGNTLFRCIFVRSCSAVFTTYEVYKYVSRILMNVMHENEYLGEYLLY